jgi:hypothetical protein
MIVTHDVRPQGHFVTIQADNITMTIRTNHGEAYELADEAADMRRKANALIRRADLIKEALNSGQLESKPLRPGRRGEEPTK